MDESEALISKVTLKNGKITQGVQHSKVSIRDCTTSTQIVHELRKQRGVEQATSPRWSGIIEEGRAFVVGGKVKYTRTEAQPGTLRLQGLYSDTGDQESLENGNRLALILTCQRVYDELIDALYSRPALVFSSLLDLALFVSRTSSARLRQVKDVILVLDGITVSLGRHIPILKKHFPNLERIRLTYIQTILGEAPIPSSIAHDMMEQIVFPLYGLENCAEHVQIENVIPSRGYRAAEGPFVSRMLESRIDEPFIIREEDQSWIMAFSQVG